MGGRGRVAFSAQEVRSETASHLLAHHQPTYYKGAPVRRTYQGPGQADQHCPGCGRWFEDSSQAVRAYDEDFGLHPSAGLPAHCADCGRPFGDGAEALRFYDRGHVPLPTVDQVQASRRHPLGSCVLSMLLTGTVAVVALLLGNLLVGCLAR